MHRGNYDNKVSEVILEDIVQHDHFQTITNKNKVRTVPDNKVHGANMGPIWGRQDPGGYHVGPIKFAIWDVSLVLSMYP